MGHPGFWDSIVNDITGRGLLGGSFQIRLILQPLLAMVLGARAGIKDAKRGELPFFHALLQERDRRGDLLLTAVRDAIIPLVVALVLDSILQQMINHHIRPVAALIVGGLLVFLPFLIVRAVANQIWRHGHHGAAPASKPSR
jgi:undecaprenyl pyrophosphate phosphatase UppP